MKIINKGISTGSISLSLLIFCQAIFPYYLFASEGTYYLSAKNIVANNIYLSTDSKNDNSFGENQLLNETDLNSNNFVQLQIPGGPDQPEVQSFTPMGTDGMVDPFSGDFSYNIPLMDVDGYPINLAYNAGVGMDQEATWVGLGWNLNPGVINRSMRGIPDDFNGKDIIYEERNQKPTKSTTVSIAADVEVFAFDAKGKKTKNPNNSIGSVNLSGSLGITYSNYSGFNADISFGPSFSIGKETGLDLGLQLSSSTQGGASIGGNIGLKSKDDDVTTKLSIGSSINSRQGVQQLSINLSQSKDVSKPNKNTKATGRNKTISGAVGGSIGSSFNFGMSTHTPQLRFGTKANAFTARFKLGPDAVGLDYSLTFTGTFYGSSITDKYLSRSAYGYANLAKGQHNSKAQMDFNRENDGIFTVNTPALPLSHLTYDIYSVSGHGVGGSYRIDREDIGYTFDPEVRNSSNSQSVGAELNLGATAKGGIDVNLTFSKGYSTAWTDGNNAAKTFRFKHDKLKFRDASELSYDRSGNEYEMIGADRPVRFSLNHERSITNQLVDGKGFAKIPTSNAKSLFFQSNQVLTPYTIKELKNGAGYEPLHASSRARATTSIDHHIGAFLVTKTDGMRYYYGLPAFSFMQDNVSFAIGKTYDWSADPVVDVKEGLTQYSPMDASVNNNKGIDNFYSRQRTRDYVHSYMLTSVLSPNYVDSDGVPGPSKDDIGDFVTFDYKRIDNYKWRNPYNSGHAYYDAGLNTDVSDDKANYIYGEKELYYLKSLTTKNHIAIFYTSPRKDAISAAGEHGGVGNMQMSMQRLDSIKLYSRVDYELNASQAIPVKTVHFVYDYSLCPQYPLNFNTSSVEQGDGKLTLRKVYFTYQNSKKGVYNSYDFVYGFNPKYCAKDVDRWGTYKRNPQNITNNLKSSPLKNADFPYVGSQKDSVDLWASAWNLSEIHTPTGGRIKVSYESDDYAFVQHKRANQMFLISGVVGQDAGPDGVVSISDNGERNRALKFNMIPNTQVSDYAKVGDVIYFRAALSMDKDKNSFDYVPGYAIVDNVTAVGNTGIITLRPERLKDSGDREFNPLAVAGVQFARNYLQRLIPPTAGSGALPDGSPLEVMQAIGAAFVNLRELFTGPNMPLWRDEIGTNILLNKSWIRLNNPNYSKLGGGHRVKKIDICDNWSQMVSNGLESCYGQEYIYSDNEKSTGVASYEPQLGGEENVWRQYVANDIKLTLAPDSRNYQETPFGEQAFPNPSVGYGKVITRNIRHSNVSKTATGYTVNEFYTTKDFPTIVKQSTVDNKLYKTNINLILLSRTVDRLALSQGFVIENNDMNGKPKSTRIYGEGQDAFLSSVEYKYQSEPIVLDGVSANKLINDATVIEKNGSVNKVTIGRSYEAVADFRETGTDTYGGGMAFNLNYTLPFVIVPMVLGSNISASNTEFRSATFTKTIERKGILYQTIAKDNQSLIVTNNLAYDAETGEILLTSVNNAFGDTIYNFTYPAHWVYDGMGQASKNLGYETSGNFQFEDGYTASLTSQIFFPGDEIFYSTNLTHFHKAWVTEANNLGIRLVNLYGEPISGLIRYVKVIRSGRRNLQSTPVGSLALTTNPLLSFTSNVFEEVLSAEAIQYDLDWKRFCNCTINESYINPYASGLKGNWFPTANYVHLSNRTQDYENENTNVREDGVFESFNPMFRLENGKWTFDKRNWTFVSQVTEFSPSGQPLETRDALSRFSSGLYGYNQQLQVAQSVNAQKRQIASSNFEDILMSYCPDKNIDWKLNGLPLTANNLSDVYSHTGKYSLKVVAGNSIQFSDTIALVCGTEDLCDFTSFISGTGSSSLLTIPYSAGIEMSYEIISGNASPFFEETSTGIRLGFQSSNGVQPFKVNVYLVDAKGCFTNILIGE